MGSLISHSDVYILGNAAAELRRLIEQARFFHDLTLQLFRLAGLERGMHILDIGCGPGDVAFLAAEIVGPDGLVIGVDRSPEAIVLAQERASAARLTNMRFMVQDVSELILDAPVDAIVGRLILMYLANPSLVIHKELAMDTHNPRITRLLHWLTGVGVLVLVVFGGGLFFLPAILGPLWPWMLAPFNTRFLGAVYVGSLVSATALAFIRRWSVARLVVPMIFTFTAIILGVSVIYFDRFTQNSLSTVAWFVLYIVIPLNTLYHLGLYRKLPPVADVQLQPSLIALLGIQVLGLGVYGILLLVAPETFGTFWPWALDDFHARMYSVAFITPALGAGLLLRSASVLELRTLGLTQIAGGAMSLVGLLIVDAAVRRVDWSAFGTWLWIGLFVGIFIMGGLLLWQGRAAAQRITQINSNTGTNLQPVSIRSEAQ